MLAFSALAACAPRQTMPRQPLGVAGHLEEAARHEQAAVASERLAARAAESPGLPLSCVDQPLAGIPYSGGERLTIMTPCWTPGGGAQRARLGAERQRRAAMDHRVAANALIETERLACAGLGETEIATGPFAHPTDIRRVQPYYEGTRLRGARILFAPVAGLTRSWLRRAIHCQIARAAVVGYEPTFMGTCPVALPGLSASVTQTDGGLLVTVRAERDEIAAAVLGRAQDLTRGRAPAPPR